MIFQCSLLKQFYHYEKIGYNSNVLQQTACLEVCNLAFLFNCTPEGWTSDPNDGSDLSLDEIVWALYCVYNWVNHGFNCWIPVLSCMFC